MKWFNFFSQSEDLEYVLAVAIKKRHNPQSTLLATEIRMLSELSKVQEQMIACNEKMQLAQRVKTLGFVNSYAVAEQNQFSKNVELLQFMVEMWHDLGSSAMLIGINQFREILHKHDLMCVNFDAYIGDIPIKNLQESEVAISKITNNDIFARYANNLSRRSYTAKSSQALLDIIRFPYFFEGNEDYALMGDGEAIIFNIEPLPQGRFFIAAPKDYVIKPRVSPPISRDFWLLSDRDRERDEKRGKEPILY